jgi:hypothetical protein
MVRVFELVRFTLNNQKKHWLKRVRLVLRAPNFFLQNATAYGSMENILR